ncbi:MAG: transposase [Eubacterium sp.]|nr:transposase [Eubacterium sp.]
MSFAKNSVQQLSFNDSLLTLTPREKRFLEKSWAHAFRENVFPKINEDMFSILYTSLAAPNAPINVLVGGLILKEALSLSDSELVDCLMFDIRFQYALRTTSFQEQPLSESTLNRFRARVLSWEKKSGQNLIAACIDNFREDLDACLRQISPKRKLDSKAIERRIHDLSEAEFYTEQSRNLYLASLNLKQLSGQTLTTEEESVLKLLEPLPEPVNQPDL